MLIFFCFNLTKMVTFCILATNTLTQQAPECPDVEN